jgi:hypothetical protein
MVVPIGGSGLPAAGEKEGRGSSCPIQTRPAQERKERKARRKRKSGPAGGKRNRPTDWATGPKEKEWERGRKFLFSFLLFQNLFQIHFQKQFESFGALVQNHSSK